MSLTLMLILCGCGKTSRPVSFPMDDDRVVAAVAELGLPWELSEDECQSYSENQRTCVLRDKTEPYTEGGKKLMRAAVSSGNFGGGDYLFLHFEGMHQTEEPEFDWGYWEKQLRLTEMLWSMKEGELYSLVSEKIEPDRIISQGTADNFVFEFALESGERCEVSWRSYPTVTTSSARTGSVVDDWGQRLSVMIFASDKVYDSIMEQTEKAAENQARK